MVAEPTSLTASQRRLLDVIDADRQALVDLCLELGNHPSYHAQEQAIAARVVDWLATHGIESWLQPITPTSANAIGRLRGTADGTSLIFNAHTDIGPPLPPDAPERIRQINQAWTEGDLLYGYGVINDKAQLAAFMIATRALLKAGIQLQGDLLLSGVAFETGHPSVGEHQGIDYPGEGFGTWWLVNRGVTADYALVGETSGFGLITAECGAIWLEVRTEGRVIYTPRMERGASWQAHPSALVRAAHLVPAIEAWATEYERHHQHTFWGGTIVPKAQIESIAGAGDRTRLRLDVRLAPGANPRAVQRELHDYLRARGFACTIEPYQWSRGYIVEHGEPLIDAVTRAHLAVHGTPPPPPPTPEISMWRDVNMFNEVGIPAICYGPPRQRDPFSDAGNRAMKIADLVAATKVYALAALNVCGEAES